jgi:hypothetical protein
MSRKRTRDKGHNVILFQGRVVLQRDNDLFFFSAEDVIFYHILRSSKGEVLFILHIRLFVNCSKHPNK